MDHDDYLHDEGILALLNTTRKINTSMPLMRVTQSLPVIQIPKIQS
jgi:hypothetical protein